LELVQTGKPAEVWKDILNGKTIKAVQQGPVSGLRSAVIFRE
jgi:hypothetical protein